MPFKRTFRRKNPVRRIRRSRRRPGIQRSMRMRRSPVYAFKRTCQLSDITVSAATGAAGALTFKLTDLPNSSEFTSLFDYFKINGVAIKIIPIFTAADANPIGSYIGLPNVSTVLDYDDATTPSSQDEIMQYQNLKQTRGHQLHKRYIKPACLVTGYESSIATAYLPKWKQWINLADVATLHYGMKYWFTPQIGTTSNIVYRVYATYYFQCKGVR